MGQITSNTISALADYLGKNPPQRVNRYSIDFSPVEGKQPDTFFATMVQIPSRSILYFPDSVAPFAPNYKVPLKHEWDEKFIVEFLVDEAFTIRKFIEDWMDSLIGNYYYNDNKTSTMTISALGINNILKPIFTLHDVWPKLISPSEFNTDRPDLLRMQVDFAYRRAEFTG